MAIGVRVGVVIGEKAGPATGLSEDPISGNTTVNLTGFNAIGFFGQSNVCGFSSPFTPAGVTMAQAITLAPSFAAPFSGCYDVRKFGQTPPDPPTWLMTGGVTQGPLFMAPRPSNADEPLGGSFGPSLSLGRYLSHSLPSPGWVIGEIALGGTSLASNWKAPPGNTYPTVGPKLIDQAITFFQGIQTSTGNALRCIIWSHGTTDALVTANANAYLTNLTAFYAYVAPFFPGVPWIIEQISSISGGGADLTTVRNAQASFVTTQNGLVPGSAFLINSESLPIPGILVNLTHYPADGYIIMGRRYAVQVLAAIAVPEVPTAEFRYFGTGTSVLFTDLTVNGNSAVNAWSWNFGDSGTASTQNPTHVYAAPGTYTVTLTATCANTKSDIISHSVIVATNAWTVDATAIKACPANLTEDTALCAAAMPSSSTSGPASHIWGMQENCQGSPFLAVDVVNAGNLSATGAFTSQAVVAGWTRVGNQWADNIANRNLQGALAALPDGAVESILLMCYWVMPAAIPVAGNPRGLQFITTTGNGDIRIALTTGKLRQNAVLNTEMINNVCTGGSQFVAIQSNLTAGSATLYTELEMFRLPFRVPATGKTVGIGGFAASSPAATCVYAKMYRGAAAEKTQDEMRALVRTSGWNPPW